MLLAVLSCFWLAPAVRAAGLWLYEGGTPDLGAAAAGRVALAADVSTAGAIPAGMTRLERSQVLALPLILGSRVFPQKSLILDEDRFESVLIAGLWFKYGFA